MSDQPPLFIRLRSGYFTEHGYNLDASAVVPFGIAPKADVSFVVLDEKSRKPLRIIPAPGLSPSARAEFGMIHLKPYPEPDLARGALTCMCVLLPRALKGDAKAQRGVGVFWRELLLEGLGLAFCSQDTQLAALQNLYGKARVADVLNRHGTTAALGAPDLRAFACEALAPLQDGELHGVALGVQ